MAQPDFDQRRRKRYRAQVRVLYFRKGQPRAVDAECRNISTEGLFVLTRRRGPEAGTPVSLLLSFEDSEPELMLEGVVRWQGEVQSLDNGTDASGMGIEFTQMEPSVRTALEHRISRLEGGMNHS